MFDAAFLRMIGFGLLRMLALRLLRVLDATARRWP
jgi:hypothetical protein